MPYKNKSKTAGKVKTKPSKTKAKPRQYKKK